MRHSLETLNCSRELSEDFVHAVDDSREHFLAGAGQPGVNSIDRERADLTDPIHRALLESRGLALGRERNSGAGSWPVIATAITVPERSLEDVMTQDENRSLPRLLMAGHGV